MTKTFHDESHGDEHGLFQKWRRQNENGFFINCKTETLWMLHRVNCWHSGDTLWEADSGASLTVQKKICSNDRNELTAEATRAGNELDTCAHCKP